MVLHNLAYNPAATATTDFNDVNGQYYANTVVWAAGEGIISGDTDGKLDPKGEATRAQVASMLMRFCK